VAVTAPFSGYLREGCLLVSASGKDTVREIVKRDGSREPFSADAEAALSYAKTAADDFGVGTDWDATFEPEAAVSAAKAKAEKKQKAKTKRGK
jgi:hypothetical protein